MRSIRLTGPIVSASISATASRNVVSPKIRSGISADEFFASLHDVSTKSGENEPRHMFAGLVILLGLELLAPALLVDIGGLGSLASVVPAMPQLFTALAFVGGAVTLAGVALLIRARYRR